MNVLSGNECKGSQKTTKEVVYIGKRAHTMFCTQEQQLLQLGAHNMILSTAYHCRVQAISSVMSISLSAHIQRLSIFPTSCFPQHFYSSFLTSEKAWDLKIIICMLISKHIIKWGNWRKITAKKSPSFHWLCAVSLIILSIYIFFLLGSF